MFGDFKMNVYHPRRHFLLLTLAFTLALFFRCVGATVSAAFSPVPLRQLSSIIGFTLCRSALYTAIVNILRPRGTLTLFLQSTLVIFLVFSLCAQSIHAQDAAQKPSEKPAEKKAEKAAPPEKAENPAQIELLETSYRFEVNGDSRKEVHTRVKINSELGVRQFARLNFDYNRSFQSIEIPLVHITHTSGGTADILPSAITDNPNPAVVDAPAYQDVRVKSVRILGLEPGDMLEYRVITTTTHHPLAPDFWLDHTFDRTGVVSQEIFELDFPSTPETQVHINPKTPVTSTQGTGENRQTYRWRRLLTEENAAAKESSVSEPDIVLTSFWSWEQLAKRLRGLLEPSGDPATDVADKASELAKVTTSNPANASELRAEAFYTFVSQKIRMIDLPLGSTGFRTRKASEILKTGYATAEDKYLLFTALTNSFGIAQAGLISSNADTRASLPRPSVFNQLLMLIRWPSINFWFDLNVEVAPFRVIPSEFRGRTAFVVGPLVSEMWRRVEDALPFQAKQTVLLDASISTEGKLTARVHYAMRGDNELVLRVAFHQSPKEKWKELAQLLSITDGFRGEVTSVNASDPYATREPFTLDYEITMPKFVDWSKKPVRIPALLPQLGLPDPPAKPVAGAATSPIELGTPLEVETRMTLHLPPGTTAQTPTGTSVQRDYATYGSQYSTKGLSISASRHINFLLREIPANRAVDYNAFLRAVQSDEAQDFTLDRPGLDDKKPAPAKPRP
jgi:hypothetical protein